LLPIFAFLVKCTLSFKDLARNNMGTWFCS
ncbi:hypothetical protein VN97_g7999, partial [Penicillium thymicola]